MSTNGFKAGGSVVANGYAFTVTRVCEWDCDLIEISNSRGTKCVDDSSVRKA